MEAFDLNSLREKLRKLPEWKRVVFMATCCERMLPNYREFYLETNHGNPNALSSGLVYIWDWIKTEHIPDKLNQIINECDQQAPDTSKFTSVYTSAALDAANSIAITLEALRGATVDMAIQVASLARDTVDLFVQEKCDFNPNSIDLEKRILETPLMQKELRRQRESLESLAGGGCNRSEIEIPAMVSSLAE